MKTRELDFVFRLGIVAVFFVNGIFKLQNIDGVTLWMESYGFPGLFIIPAIAIEIIAPILILFNPIVPVYLYDKGLWTMIDIASGIAFWYESEYND